MTQWGMASEQVRTGALNQMNEPPAHHPLALAGATELPTRGGGGQADGRASPGEGFSGLNPSPGEGHLRAKSFPRRGATQG